MDQSGITVFPAFYTLTYTSGQKYTVQVTIKNTTNQLYIYSLGFKDIATESFSSKNIKQVDTEAGPSTWLRSNIQEVIVDPNSEKKVDVEITIPAGAKVDNVYPAVFFERRGTQSGNSVNVGANFLVPLYMNIDKTDKSVDAEIITFTLKDKFVIQPHMDADMLLRNVSREDVFIQPRGRIFIFDNNGNRLQETPTVNDSFKILLQGDSLKENYSWSGAQSLMPKFGEYRVVIEVFPDGVGNKKITKEETFWVIPVFHILAGVFVLLTLIAAYFIFASRLKRNKKKKTREEILAESNKTK